MAINPVEKKTNFRLHAGRENRKSGIAAVTLENDSKNKNENNNENGAAFSAR